MSTWDRWRRWVLARNAATMALLASPTAHAADDEKPLPDDTRYVDAHCDHVVLSSTAETHPKGTFFFTDYELIQPHVGYALTDRYELALTWLAFAWLDVAMKLNVHRGKLLRSAVIGGFDVPLGTSEYEAQPAWRLVAIQQLCFTRACWSSVSANAVGLVHAGGNDPTTSTAFAFSAGGILALSSLVKLLVEPSWVWVPAESSQPYFGVAGGVRISGTHFGVDLGWIPGSELGALPWLAFTYRTSGERPSE